MRSPCPHDDILYDYLDHDQLKKISPEIREHVQGCARCREKLEQLLNERGFVFEKISALNPAFSPVPPPFKRHDRYSVQQNGISWLFKTKFKPAWAVVILLLVVFLFKPSLLRRTETMNYSEGPRLVDSLSIHASPRDSVKCQRWFAPMQDTTLIKTLLSSKRDATIVYF